MQRPGVTTIIGLISAGAALIAAGAALFGLSTVSEQIRGVEQVINTEIKKDVLRRVVGYRFLLTRRGCVLQNGEPFVSLNEALVVFADEPDVVIALRSLGGDEAESALVPKMIRLMARSAGVPLPSSVVDKDIQHPLTPPMDWVCPP